MKDQSLIPDGVGFDGVVSVHQGRTSNQNKDHLDVSKNRGTPKWMVYNEKTYKN